MKRWYSDLCSSVTPVLGGGSGGQFMKNSPQYAAWWCLSRASDFLKAQAARS